MNRYVIKMIFSILLCLFVVAFASVHQDVVLPILGFLMAITFIISGGYLFVTWLIALFKE